VASALKQSSGQAGSLGTYANIDETIITLLKHTKVPRLATELPVAMAVGMAGLSIKRKDVGL
jgi:hypothetical protein